MALGERSDLAHRKKIEAEIIKDVDAIICSSTHEKNLINSYIDVPDKVWNIVICCNDHNFAIFKPIIPESQ